MSGSIEHIKLYLGFWFGLFCGKQDAVSEESFALS